MKLSTLVMISAALASSLASASEFKRLEEPSRASLKKVWSAMMGVDTPYGGVFEITKKTVKPGRTEEEAHMAALKESMHKYMCSFFDEGINISRQANNAAGARAALKDLDIDYNGGGEEKMEKAFAKIEAPLIAALKSDDVEVYSGDASGNNTSGTVIGIYDAKNDEILTMGFTNCGSDD